jgi:JmjC domain, hydroxylase
MSRRHTVYMHPEILSYRYMMCDIRRPSSGQVSSFVIISMNVRRPTTKRRTTTTTTTTTTGFNSSFEQTKKFFSRSKRRVREKNKNTLFVFDSITDGLSILLLLSFTAISLQRGEKRKMGWKTKLHTAKKLHRPSLNDWECDGLYDTFPNYVRTIPPPSLSSSSSSSSSSSYHDPPPPPPKSEPCTTVTTKLWIVSPSVESSSSSKNDTNDSITGTCIPHGTIVPTDHGISSPTTTTTTIRTNDVGIPIYLDARTLPTATFRNQYEAQQIPCILQNIPAGYDNGIYTGSPWKAMERWTLDRFNDDDHHHQHHHHHHGTQKNSLRECYFKCGEDDHGKSIKVKLKYFLRYIQDNRDDSPLYIFDSHSLDRPQEYSSYSYDAAGSRNHQNNNNNNMNHDTSNKNNNNNNNMNHDTSNKNNSNSNSNNSHSNAATGDQQALFSSSSSSSSFVHDYVVPSYFQPDLFQYISHRRRPPYRWMLIGPQRSGTCIHIDPLGTHAWNTLMVGQKRWVLFPPHVAKHIVKGKGLIQSHEDDEAIHYFMTILPRIQQRAHRMRHTEEYTNFACYEFTQHAGETVFVPHGWWHAVLNITDTIGVTQNYASFQNFDSVWKQIRTHRKRMAWKLLQQLQIHHPHLAQRAKQMNEQDQFVMKYDPVQIRKRQLQQQHRKKDPQQQKVRQAV